ncbi:hypothetical protein RIF29_18555 [Crotalaria pallida]|uniref:Pectinesterase inhibitor domain-containing protein n=1 Tax=Crotalaria pallida TaxID=3830 RepID=A0AAN9IE06_CROPI
MNYSLLFTTLSLILTISHAMLAASGINLHEELCKQAGADDNARCSQILKSESAKDYVELSRYVLQIAVKRSIEGQNYLKGVMKTNPSSKAIKECATTHYDGVVGSFKSALGELKVDPMTANYDAKVGGDGPTTCNRALAEEKINNPSIAALNSDILLLSKLAYLATDKIPRS